MSNTVLIQLETALYKDFIDKFALFAQLKIPMIRYIKQNVKLTRGKLKLINSSSINDI